MKFSSSKSEEFEKSDVILNIRRRLKNIIKLL